MQFLGSIILQFWDQIRYGNKFRHGLVFRISIGFNGWDQIQYVVQSDRIWMHKSNLIKENNIIHQGKNIVHT